MAVFTYQALDSEQQSRQGTITADTAALARQALRAQGLAVAGIAETRPARRSLSSWLAPGRGLRSRGQDEAVAELWRNLAVLLRAGVPLAEALDVCQRQLKGPLRTILQQVLEAVRSGRALAEVLRAHQGWVDELTLSVVEVGQRSGTLAASLAELAEYQSRRRTVANKLSTALIYPAILCVVGTGVVLFLMSYVIPQLLDVLATAGRELPAPTRLLKTLSDALLAHGPLLAAGCTAIVAALIVARRTERGRRAFERAALALPVLGDLLRKAWIARISLMLSTMLRSDVRFTDALRTLRRGLPHRLYADELARLESAIEAGANIADPLKDSQLMPPLVVHLLAVGQESGELPRMLDELRAGYEQHVQLALGRFLAVLEPALILILAIVIGFVVFAFMVLFFFFIMVVVMGRHGDLFDTVVGMDQPHVGIGTGDFFKPSGFERYADGKIDFCL